MKNIIKLNIPGVHIRSAAGVIVNLLILGHLSAASASRPGAAGGQILELNTAARPAAMGDAFSGIADGIQGALYNPGGLTQLSSPEFEFSHMLYFLDTSMSSAGYGQKIGPAGVGVYLQQFTARDTQRDFRGEKLGGFDVKFARYTVAAAVPADDGGQSFGAAANILTESIFGETASAFSFDFGWHYLISERNSYGMAVRNIGGGIKVYESEADLPREAVFAGKNTRGRFLFLWEISTSRHYGYAWRSGFQVSAGNNFMLRGGFKYLDNPEFTAGFGVSAWNWVFDYAFLPNMSLGAVHRFSLGIRL